MPSNKNPSSSTLSLCRVVIPASGEVGVHQCRQKAPGKRKPHGWDGLHFLPAGWVAPKSPGASALCSSSRCGLSQGCGFSRLPGAVFLQEFRELERLGEPVNKDLAGHQGCKIVR